MLATGTTLPLHFDLDVERDRARASTRSTSSRGQRARAAPRPRRRRQRRCALNQLQALGTHNSYHEYPQPPIDGIQQLQYFEDPLDVQLQSQGVRQFELDVHVNIAPAGTFSVLHIEGVDENTTCKAFLDCLNTIKTWSDAHPQHIPIGIQLELKNADIALPNLPYRAVDARRPRHARRDDPVGVPREPHVHARRPARRPRHAAGGDRQDGWPTIDSARGKVMFVMDNSGTFRDWYRTGHDALQGRVIFTNADPGDADAAFIKTNDPKGQFAEIQSLIAQGYITRTRADADTVEARANDTTARDAAFASGSTWVSSDFVVPGRAQTMFGSPYVVQIPGGTPARCNPINTPTWCTSPMIESLPPADRRAPSGAGVARARGSKRRARGIARRPARGAGRRPGRPVRTRRIGPTR